MQGFLFGVDRQWWGSNVTVPRAPGRGWNRVQRELAGQAVSQSLAVGRGFCPPLCCSSPYAGLLSLGLAHQSLLALMLGCDVPLLGELGSRTEQSHW